MDNVPVADFIRSTRDCMTLQANGSFGGADRAYPRGTAEKGLPGELRKEEGGVLGPKQA